jgi:hypothetical protein
VNEIKGYKKRERTVADVEKPKVKKATPAETSEEDYGDVVIDSDDDDDEESAPWDN